MMAQSLTSIPSKLVLLKKPPKSKTGVGISSSNPLPHPGPIIPPHLSRALPIFRDIPDLSSQVKLLGNTAIASGCYSNIWLGELSNGQQVAVKVMIPIWPNRSETNFLKELYVWSRAVPHEHVLPLLGIVRVMDSIAFVSPYMPGRSLDIQLPDCSIPDRLRILTEIAGALAHLHRKKIVYGYLALSTVVLDQNKKAYLSSFYFSNTDWTELIRANSNRHPDESSPISTKIPNVQRTWQRDVLVFGWFFILVVTKTAHSMTNVQRNHLVKSFFEDEELKGVLGLSGLPEEIWTVVKACFEKYDTKRPTMHQVFVQMSRMHELIVSSTNTATELTKLTVRDITSEIKKLNQHPIAGGGYCDIYLGERLGKERVALKLVRLFGPTKQDEKVARRRFFVEAQVWSDLHHARILEFYGICEIGTGSMYMVSPFLSNGNIMHYLNKVNIHANRHKLLIETAEGLFYLHNRDPPVIHGDLKGGNILISDSGDALLADFGLSRISHEITSSILHGAGSPRWMAPELMTVDDTTAEPLRTLQSDVYGFGHVMLEVLSNEKPFFNIRDELRVVVELLHQRRPARPNGPIASQWLDDMRWAFCQQCADIDPTARPTMSDVLSYLRKTFL